MKRSAPARRGSAVIAVILSFSFVAASFVTAPPAGATITSSEYKVARYVNNSRSARGIAKLRVSGVLSDIARRHSRAMAENGGIYHTRDLGYTLRRYEWEVAGENVGRGPRLWDIHVAFMKSAGHRANILYRSFKKVGVGVVYKNGRAYVTQIFIG